MPRLGAPALLAPLGDATYRRLLAAQVPSLIRTRPATMALGLLAWELPGADAG